MLWSPCWVALRALRKQPACLQLSCTALSPCPTLPHSPLPPPLLPQDIVKHKRLRLAGIVGIFPANSVGDDIEVYGDESRAEVGCWGRRGKGRLWSLDGQALARSSASCTPCKQHASAVRTTSHDVC